MPPQPGVFAVPHGPGSHHHQSHPQGHQYPASAAAGPSSRHGAPGEEGPKKKRKEPKVPKETNERREEARHYAENIAALHNTSHILSTRPELSPVYMLRMFPLSLERSALLAQLEVEERYSLECAQVAYEEERERVEDEWKRGRERVREKLLEGIEERRRRAREEKEGEGIIGDASLDSHSRPPITRKLRNKLGTSPPPTPHNGANGGGASGNALSFPITNANGTGLASNLPITTGPFLNPHSLSVEDLPSPFPLPLTSSHLPHGLSGGAPALGGSLSVAGNAPNGGSRRRVKGGGTQGQAVGVLGKSMLIFNSTRDNDLESDLGEIRRGNKRRRA
ncbi:hypothetical protein CPC08DRAFT_596054, partial [Agrocybe pediades]